MSVPPGDTARSGHCSSGVCALCPRAAGQGATLEVCGAHYLPVCERIRTLGGSSPCLPIAVCPYLACSHQDSNLDGIAPNGF